MKILAYPSLSDKKLFILKLNFWLGFFILMPNLIFAQHFIMLKNGEVFEFSSLKIKEDGVKIVSKEKGNFKLPFSDISGYYNTHLGLSYFLKKGIPDGATEYAYQFDKLVVEGEINLYERTHFSSDLIVRQGGAGSSGQWIEIYLEKNNLYRGLDKYGLTGISNKKRKEILLDFIKDDAQLVNEVENKDFKCSDLNIYKIVGKYNLSKLSSIKTDSSESTVFFYLKRNGNSAEVMKLFVNGKFIVDLEESKVVSTNISNQNFSKICINNYCGVIKSSPYHFKYYGIVAKENEIIVLLTDAEKANRQMVYLLNK